MKTDADVPDAVAGFKERTNEKFHRIDGLGPADIESQVHDYVMDKICLLYTSPSPRDRG